MVIFTLRTAELRPVRRALKSRAQRGELWIYFEVHRFSGFRLSALSSWLSSGAALRRAGEGTRPYVI
jgi:hypothetical protein